MTVLSDDGGSMRVVMLDSDQRAAACLRKARGRHIGMQIMGDDGGIVVKNQCEMTNRLFKHTNAFGRIEIANMLGDERFVVPRDGDGRLQRTANSEYGRHRSCQPDRFWNIATGATNALGAARHNRHDGVIRTR